MSRKLKGDKDHQSLASLSPTQKVSTFITERENVECKGVLKMINISFWVPTPLHPVHCRQSAPRVRLPWTDSVALGTVLREAWRKRRSEGRHIHRCQ